MEVSVGNIGGAVAGTGGAGKNCGGGEGPTVAVAVASGLQAGTGGGASGPQGPCGI